MPNFKKYVDPAAKFLKDWEWKKMTEVGEKVPTAVPDYVQKTYGDFMQKQLDRAMKGELSPRDVLKAYGITQSSMGRRGVPHASATRTGMKIPKTDELVRPEGAFAEWLGSPAGQQFLTHAERGEVHPGAMDDLREKFLPFGKQNQLVDKLTYGVENAPSWGRDINRVITGNVDDYRDWAEGINGIAGAKTGFIGSLLGRGDLPTFDARQINLHTEAPPVGMASIMKRGGGQGAREAVDRLAARQTAMEMDLDPSLMPFYQHLGHHAVWDKVGDSATTHEDLVRAMQNYADGGAIKGYAGGKIIKAGLDMLLPAAENAARTQIAGTVPTYVKAANMLQNAPGRMIDFGAGLGKGAEAMGQQLGRRVETYEPFAQNWAPDFVRASEVPSDAYGALTNLNVLNVVPRETRDEIVKDIGRVMQPGGTGIITTRGKDVMTAQGRPGPEPMSMITSRDTYQKGFTKQELEDYLKYMLGSGYDINRLNLGPAGVLLRKK